MIRLDGAAETTRLFAMAHYEVHRLIDNRWLLDAVFDDRAKAIEDAKNIIARARTLLAVRVLRVEEHSSGFSEWVIYNETTAEEVEATAARRRRRHVSERLRSFPGSVAAAARSLSSTPAARPSPWLLLVVLALAGMLLVFSHHPEPGAGTWVFDRPEAKLPHEVRNPLTGAVSH